MKKTIALTLLICLVLAPVVSAESLCNYFEYMHDNCVDHDYTTDTRNGYEPDFRLLVGAKACIESPFVTCRYIDSIDLEMHANVFDNLGEIKSYEAKVTYVKKF